MPDPKPRRDGPRSTAVADACFAPCPRGLEEVLVEELAEIGIADAVPAPGGVHFQGDWLATYRVNLRSRIASRVLKRVAQGRYRTEDDIHRLAMAQDWSQWFDVDQTLRVDVVTGSGRQKSSLKSLEFVTLRVKDGICDRFRQKTGARPSIDTRAPDVRVYAYLDAHACTLYLDTSGEPLFKRGVRAFTGEAPLRENLAAGILRLAGWKPGTALLDPMCGSGTFVIEAAQMAMGLHPGGQRRFGFERLKNFDAAGWTVIRDQAIVVPDPVAAFAAIRASDVSGDAVASTRANLERAGIPPAFIDAIAPKQIDARQIRPHAETGLIVSNPPYGERIAIRGEASESPDDAATAFFAEFGTTLKQRFAGWTCHLLTSDMDVQRKLRLSPDRRVPLYNGAIECRLFRFPLVAGSHR